MDYSPKLETLLERAFIEKASDLHISVGRPPILRISGKLMPLIRMKDISSEEARGLAFALMNENQQQKFLTEKSIDFSYSFRENVRFRVNVFFQEEEVACALRLIPNKIKTIQELSLPPILHEFIRHNQGFILVDATYKPVNKMKDKERKAAILSDFSNLIDDLESINGKESQLILIKANICRLLEDELTLKGFRVLNERIVVPFPSSGHQKRFHTEIAKILKYNTRSCPIGC